MKSFGTAFQRETNGVESLQEENWYLDGKVPGLCSRGVDRVPRGQFRKLWMVFDQGRGGPNSGVGGSLLAKHAPGEGPV